MGKKEKTELGTEVKEGLKSNPTHIWPYLYGIVLTPFPNRLDVTSPQYATVTSTKNNLQY